MKLTLLYFARVADRVGTTLEEVDWPVNRVSDVIAYLAERGEAWTEVFGGESSLVVMVNRQEADIQTALADGDAVAFIPKRGA